MSDKMARFTPRALRAFRLAQQAAQQHHNDQIEPEHLLVGLASDDGGNAAVMLRAWGVEPVQVIRAVRRVASYGERVFADRPVLALQTKQSIEQAVEEARKMGDSLIHTEHLLLGLVQAGDSLVVRVLQALGVDVERVRSQTKRPPQQDETGDGNHDDNPV